MMIEVLIIFFCFIFIFLCHIFELIFNEMLSLKRAARRDFGPIQKGGSNKARRWLPTTKQPTNTTNQPIPDNPNILVFLTIFIT